MKKMLIVDDDKQILKLLKKVFTDENIKISTAVNGLEAVKLCTKKNFDIILLDIVMPELDGVEAAKAIKISQPDVKIIVITGNASETQIEQVKKLNIKDIFEKPFSFKLLKKRVKKMLS